MRKGKNREGNGEGGQPPLTRERARARKRTSQLFKMTPVVKLTPLRMKVELGELERDDRETVRVKVEGTAGGESGCCYPVVKRKRILEHVGGNMVVVQGTGIGGKLLGREIQQLRGILREFDEEQEEQARLDRLPRLPPEIIQMIMGYLAEPRDLINCSKASPVLDGLLEQRKPQYLFGKVLPHIFNRLSFQDILSCRLVCRQWLLSIDSLIEHRPYREPYNDAFQLQQMTSMGTRFNFGNTRFSTFNPCVSLRTTPESLGDFLQTCLSLQFIAANRHPFFGRSLDLTLDLDAIHRRDRIQHLIRFLEHFGTHIWYCRLFVVPHQFQEQAYLYCRNLFMWLPNLRSFSVAVQGFNPENPGTLQHAQLVADVLARTPNFEPNLRHLQTLEVVQSPLTPYILTNTLTGPLITQLHKLVVSYWTNEFLSVLPNLQDLTLYHVSSNRQFQALLHLQAPLEKLTIVFRFRWVDVHLFNRVLSRFPLRHLTIEWAQGVRPFLNRPLQNHGALYRIPTLHTLFMGHSPEVNYSFLRWFPNLAYVYLTEFMPSDLRGAQLATPPPAQVLRNIIREESVKIHEYLYYDAMEWSNVWNVLRKLRTISYDRVRTPGQNENWNERGPRDVYSLAWESRR